MPVLGEQVQDQLERFVVELEKRTSAELVVVLAHRAEPYRDIPYRVGALVSLVVLAGLLFLPAGFHPGWVLAETAAAFGLGFLAAHRSQRLARWLTSDRRRARSTEAAARRAFYERGVSLTRERTGVLLFIGWLERRAVLLADVGVERRLPLDEWNAVRRCLQGPEPMRRFPQGLIGCFEPVGELLAERLPAAADNPNEIPDRPVVIE